MPNWKTYFMKSYCGGDLPCCSAGRNPHVRLCTLRLLATSRLASRPPRDAFQQPADGTAALHPARVELSKCGQIDQSHFGVSLVDVRQHAVVLVQKHPGSEKLEQIEIARAHGPCIIGGVH